MSKATQRRLAAIVAADVVGYSRLMGVDEVGTLAALQAHRSELIDGKVYNVGYDNASVLELAETVRDIVSHDNELGGEIELEIVPTDDNRSYRISSQKIADELGFTPEKNVADAVRDLLDAFKTGRLKNTMDDEQYYNIKTMQSGGLG